ncbi:MAG: endonuclease/exonuclease/phosphatase family protein [Myxococcales bacterium]|nr:endonuclease/exonuclease/phosphatase family protein [Myxococcales bacterium]
MPPRRWPRRLALGLATLTLLGLALGELGRWWWLADLATHFRAQALAPAGLALLLALWARHRLALALSAAAVAWTVAAVAPLYRGATPAPAAGTLELLVANVNRSTGDPAAVAALIAASDADVVGLVEVDDRWLAALAPALARYPHRLAETRDDNFGLALYSRLPFQSAAALRDRRDPLLLATVQVAGTPVGLLLVHPPPPVSADVAAWRDAALADFAVLRRGLPARVAVLGDLNATPWSRPLVALLAAADLREGRAEAGAGLAPTWPAQLPGFLRIPIDHVLVGGPMTLTRFALGPPNGSDHLPVRATLAVQAVAPGAAAGL